MTRSGGAARLRVPVVALLVLALVVPPAPVAGELPRVHVPAFLRLPRLHVAVPNPLALVGAAWNGAAGALSWTWHAMTDTGTASADDPPPFDAGAVTTLAGDGTHADTDGSLPAQLAGANGVAASGTTVWVATDYQLRKIDRAAGTITTVAGSPTVSGCTPNVDPALVRFNGDEKLATDGTNVFSAGACGLWRITPSGSATSLVSGAMTDVAYGPDGYLYVTLHASEEHKVLRVDRATGVTTTMAPLTTSDDDTAVAADATAVYFVVNGVIKKRSFDSPVVSDFRTADPLVGTNSLLAVGDFLFGDGGTARTLVRRYSKTTGNPVVVAGMTTSLVHDGTGSDAGFGVVRDIAFDGTSLFVADDSGNRVRQVASVTAPSAPDPAMPPAIVAGDVTTVTTSQPITSIRGIVALGGDVWISGENRLRKASTSTWSVTNVAGDGTAGCANGLAASVRFQGDEELATDGHAVYSVSVACGAVRRTAPDGTTSQLMALHNAAGIAWRPHDGLYVTGDDAGVGRLYRIDPYDGAVTVVATFGSQNLPDGVAVDGAAAYVALTFDGARQIRRVDLTSFDQTPFRIDDPELGLHTLESAGAFFYGTGPQDATLRRYALDDGSQTTVAGNFVRTLADGIAADASFHDIEDITSDGTAIYVADDTNDRIRKIVAGTPFALSPQYAAPPITLASVVTMPTAAPLSGLSGITVRGSDLWVVSNAQLLKVDMRTGVSTVVAGAAGVPGCSDGGNGAAARFQGDEELATDGYAVYSVSQACHTVRRTSPDGRTRTLAALTEATGIAIAPDGMLYAVGTANQHGALWRIHPTNGGATVFKQLDNLDLPRAVAVDADAAWVTILSSGGSSQHVLRRVDLATKAVTELVSDPSGAYRFGGNTLHDGGDVLYADGPSSSSVVTITKATLPENVNVSLVAGMSDERSYADGLGYAARFNRINDFTSDGAFLYVADGVNNRIRAVYDDSLLLPGGEAFGDDPYTGWRDDVNPALRAFETSADDVALATAGPRLGVTRTYNSLDTRWSAFGRGWTFEYDMTWRRNPTTGAVTVLFPDGRRETHEHNADGSYATPPGYFSVLAASGSGYTLTTREKTVYAFDAATHLTSITDANGRAVTLTYAGDKVVSATDGTGRALAFTWTGVHVTSVKTSYVAAHGRQLEWRYYYDGPVLTRVCDPIDNAPTGRCTVYGYTGDLLTSITRPEGNVVTTVAYDGNGKVTSRGDGHGRQTTYAFDTGTNEVVVTDARDHVTRQSYDAQFRLTSETDAAGETTTYEYDARGVRYRVTDPNQDSVVTNTDARGNAVSVTNAEGEVRRTEYDANDRVVAERDARSTGATDDTYVVRYTYDAAGNRLTQQMPPTAEFPQGRTTSWTYSTGAEAAIGGGAVPPGLMWTSSDYRGNVTTYRYDSHGDLRSTTDPVGLRSDYTYDELGRALTTTVFSDSFPFGVTTTTVTYDELGHVLTSTGPAVANTLSGVTHRSRTANVYDRNGNLTSSTVGDLTGGDASRVTTMAYDGLDRVAGVTDPEGGVTSRTYDENGNVATITDAEGRVQRATYDARNLLTRIDLLGYVDPATPGSPRDVPLLQRTYDDAGRKLTDTDPLGRVTRTAYDHAGRVTSLTLKDYANRDASTRDVVLEATAYDAAGHVTSKTTGNGRLTVATAYDEGGWVVSRTVDPATPQHPDALNRVTTYTHDRDGNVLAETRTDGTRTEQMWTTYDATSRVLSRTVENGATDLVTTYGYDQRGLQITATDPRGNTTTGAYDALGRLVLATLPAVTVEDTSGVRTEHPATATGYDTFGDATHARDARGATTTSAYDRLGRRTGVTYPSYVRPSDGATLTPSESFAYDHVGNVVSHTDRSGAVTDSVFDPLDREVTRTDPLVTGAAARGTTVTTYDDAGNPTRVVDQRGDRTDRTYDALNRVRTQAAFDGASSFVTTYDYDDAGNATYTRSPGGAETTATYSVANERLTSTDAAGKITRYTYDLAGRVTLVRDPMNRQTSNEYDFAGRLTTVRRLSPAGAVLTTESRGHDGDGNVTSSTSGRGFTTTYAFDAADRLTSVVRPVTATSSITTSYGYDAAGGMTRMTNGNGAVTTYTYNAWGLPEKVIEPSTTAHPALADRTFTTSYDAAGRAVTESQPGGVTVARTYDALGRLTDETGSGAGVATATRHVGYDLTGLVTSFSHPGGTESLTYDGRKLPLAASGPAGSLSLGRNADGRVTSRTDAAGTSTFHWTPRGELDRITDGASSTVQVNTFNDDGQLLRASYRLASSEDTERSRRDLAYDDLGHAVNDKLTTAGVTQAFHETNYDEDGNVKWQRVTFGTMPLGTQYEASYGYDNAGRLTQTNQTKPSMLSTAYTWDGADNRTAEGAASFVYDARNRLLSGPAGTYAYTARGTLASLTTPNPLPLLPPTVTTYAFDGLGRFTGANGAATYAYDSLDRIASRAGSAFAYAGTEPDPVSDGTYSYGRLPGGGLQSVASGTSSALAGFDQHGDVTYTFSALGAVGGGRVYGPFGTVVASTAGGSVLGSLGFQADYTDTSSGDVAMGARWYRPGTGAFLSRDSVLGSAADPATLNRYVYANANPLRFTDPDGHAAIDSATASTMAEYHANVARQNRLEAEARAYGIPVQLNGRDRPWFGADSLRSLIEPLRQNHHCNCDFSKQSLPSRWPGLGDIAHIGKQAFKNVVNMPAAIANGGIRFVMDTADVVVDGYRDIGILGDCLTGGSCHAAHTKLARPKVSYVFNDRESRSYTGAMDHGTKLALELFTAGKGLKSLYDTGGAVLTRLRSARALAEMTEDGTSVLRTSAFHSGVDAEAATSGVRASAESCLNSFTADTPVLMADGTKQPIARVKVGDKVVATDPEGGRTEAKPVTALIRHMGKHRMVDLDISDGSKISATDHHPFWSVDTRRFTDAVDLRVGDKVVNDRGRVLTIVDKHEYNRTLIAYNLQVDGIHTYYAGATPVLVHNSCTTDLDVLSRSGASLDPADAGGALTRAGRAYTKAGEVFGTTSGGPPVINDAGQAALDEVLTNPGTTMKQLTKGNFAGGLRFVSPDGVGAVFGPDSVFQYFGWMTQ